MCWLSVTPRCKQQAEKEKEEGPGGTTQRQHSLFCRLYSSVQTLHFCHSGDKLKVLWDRKAVPFCRDENNMNMHKNRGALLNPIQVGSNVL